MVGNFMSFYIGIWFQFLEGVLVCFNSKTELSINHYRNYQREP